MCTVSYVYVHVCSVYVSLARLFVCFHVIVTMSLFVQLVV